MQVATRDVEFSIKPLNKVDNYYGFELFGDPFHISPDGVILHNSGKSVMEQNIVGHVSRFSDRFQLIGVDCKRVEFNLLRGVKGVKGVALDVPSSAMAIDAFRMLMMDRFKFMEESQVNNVYKIKDKEVNYYEVFGETVQFDEIYELMVDLDKSDTRAYEKMKLAYPDGRQPLYLTIQQIYEGMLEDKWKGRHPQLQEHKGYNSYLSKDSIRMTKGIYVPKALLFLADELNELMNSEDYKSVETVRQCLGSIARLGRAAGVHLALACQRAGSGTINGDLKNNIQLSVLLGAFDSSASTMLFEKDISNRVKPEIKGRAFMAGLGEQPCEIQTYFTQPVDCWEFDTNLKLTFSNPEFFKQCKARGIDAEALNTGWVDQIPIEDEEVEEDLEDFEDDEDMEDEDSFYRPSPKVQFKNMRSGSRDSGRDRRPERPDRDKPTDKPIMPPSLEELSPIETSTADLDAMFGGGKTETTIAAEEKASEPTSPLEPSPISKPSIKLKPVSSENKPKIKLNFAPKSDNTDE